MVPPFVPETVDLTAEEVAAERRLYGGLARSVRRLMQASLRTTQGSEVVQKAVAAIDAVSEQLESRQIPGSFGVSVAKGGEFRGYGNAVVGLRNPVALPLEVVWGEDGHTRADFDLNALYEGPPHLAHGGVVALLLDQVMGEASAAGGVPGMTGTLTVRYERPTPLGRGSIEAWTQERGEVKSTVIGLVRDTDGEVTVRAEGLFITPRWAREALARGEEAPQRYE